MNQLAVCTANPSLQYVMALKEILQYLAGTKNFGITYFKTSNNPNNNSNISMDLLMLPMQTTTIMN